MIKLIIFVAFAIGMAAGLEVLRGHLFAQAAFLAVTSVAGGFLTARYERSLR